MTQDPEVADPEADRDLLVVGDGPVADALTPMAGLLGWQVLAAVTLPEALAGLRTARAVVVTSHHAEVDGPALKAALGRMTGGAGEPAEQGSPGSPAYLGAMGSRRTQTRRREYLLANGVAETDLAQVHGPTGLDIGADSPAEIALSILAELTAVVRRAPASGSISGRSGPIHPDLPPGEAFCPTG